MTVHSVSSKGWVVIAVELHKKYGLQPDAEVRIVDYGRVLAITPALNITEWEMSLVQAQAVLAAIEQLPIGILPATRETVLAAAHIKAN